MVEVKAGFAFHCHHDILVERCHNFDERVKYIKDEKPEGERELRLRLFRLIPSDRLPPELVKVVEAYNKTRKAYDKAVEASNKARKAHVEAGGAYYEAGGAYYEAKKACDNVERRCMPEIIKLHQELCPDCPWDGQTIFSLKSKEEILSKGMK